MIHITNTLTGLKEPLKLSLEDPVTLYVCGVTPYDYAHVGHGRCYVSFDLLYRFLQFLGYDVRYCRNFTDIDDKLLKRAQEKFGDKMRYTELADKFIDAYHCDVEALNCLSPTYEPRVTTHIPQIIDFVQALIDKGHAYQVGSSVYFHISSFPTYGKLSKHNVADLRAGERVQVDKEKKDPLDFALWKGESKGEFWKSPWGWGRPGWHIECSTLAREYLGDTLDIHAGGLDLVFPHHENEIAQSEARTKKPFARYWLHNGFVQINKEKMSKSLGNFFTLGDIFKKFDPMVIRYYFLNHHYRAPLDFAFDDIKAAEKSYRKLIRLFSACEDLPNNGVYISEFSLVKRMVEFLENDLNTSGLLGIVFESFSLLREDSAQLCAVKKFLVDVLGLTLEPLPEQEVEMTPEIEALIQKRSEARGNKNWKRADEIRDELRELGFDVQDAKI